MYDIKNGNGVSLTPFLIATDDRSIESDPIDYKDNLMLIDSVINSAKSILREDEDAVYYLVANRKGFENWLQIEIFKRLMRSKYNPNLELERSYLGRRKRCDFWCPENDNRQSWVEVKLCITNYLRTYFRQYTTQPITEQIRAIIRDAERLRTVPERSTNRHIFLLAYPMPPNYETHWAWSRHIDKIQSNGGTALKEFVQPVQHSGHSASVVAYKIGV